jgi:hypothetical protein
MGSLGDLTLQWIDEGLASIGERAPRTIQRLEKAAERLSSASDPGDFQSVALHCRDALIDYADSVFSPEYVGAAEMQPAYDQFVKKLALTLSHFGDLAGSDKARGLLRALAGHVQSRQHDQTTSASEAAGTLHLTLATVLEMERLLEVAAGSEELVKDFRIYRCPVCRSRSLKKDAVVEHDGDGPVLAGWYVYCDECDWSQFS